MDGISQETKKRSQYYVGSEWEGSDQERKGRKK